MSFIIYFICKDTLWRCRGLLVSELVFPGSSGPVSTSFGHVHYVVFLSKTLNLTPTGEFNIKGKPAMDKPTIQGEVEMLPVASCY